MRKAVYACLMIAGSLSLAAETQGETVWKHFRGMCDASAAEMLDNDLFVAANDEDNVLRIYSRTREGLPVQALDFSGFFRLPKRSAEIDLEGSARIGDRIYWISSHGANAKGKYQSSRHRFFATQVVTNAGALAVRPVGRLYPTLVRDLTQEPSLAHLGLAAAAQKPPKAKDALNIEGLAATPEKHLLIAFRNPIPGGKALIIPLLNPEEVTSGKKAVFGKQLLLDLKGYGIRSITPDTNGFLVVAGPYDSEGASRLYHWDGHSATAAPLTPRGLAANPEGIAIVKNGEKTSLFILSDDGTRKIGGKDCKKLKDASLKTFRGYELPL